MKWPGVTWLKITSWKWTHCPLSYCCIFFFFSLALCNRVLSVFVSGVYDAQLVWPGLTSEPWKQGSSCWSVHSGRIVQLDSARRNPLIVIRLYSNTLTWELYSKHATSSKANNIPIKRIVRKYINIAMAKFAVRRSFLFEVFGCCSSDILCFLTLRVREKKSREFVLKMSKLFLTRCCFFNYWTNSNVGKCLYYRRNKTSGNGVITISPRWWQ